MKIEELKGRFPEKPLGKKSIDITGNVYGKLTALYRTENFKQPNGTVKSMWLCSCECGNYKPVMYCNLKANNISSCGKCANNVKRVFRVADVEGVTYGKREGMGNTKHGLSHHPLYTPWVGVIKRCYDKEFSGYKYYGGKGVSVCGRWLNLENFIEDNLPQYREGLTLDRVDTAGDYCPENTRWITLAEQSINTGPKHWGKVKYKGVCWSETKEAYRANLFYNGKQTHLGFFSCPIDAALKYDEVVEREKGSLAWLNRNFFSEVMEAFNLQELPNDQHL